MLVDPGATALRTGLMLFDLGKLRQPLDQALPLN